ncbi:hypothetical protein ACOSQ4_018327 [Xanthoceras sorbifolium]
MGYTSHLRLMSSSHINVKIQPKFQNKEKKNIDEYLCYAYKCYMRDWSNTA